MLPILSHTDSLTINEIQKVREIVRQDLAKVFDRDEGAGFGILGIHDNDEPMVRHLVILWAWYRAGN